VSIPTINKHVQKVLQKLDVRNRVQAIARLDAESAARGYRDFDAGS
jgi:DNA-binding NarL/FixJ family response regulator